MRTPLLAVALLAAVGLPAPAQAAPPDTKAQVNTATYQVGGMS